MDSKTIKFFIASLKRKAAAGNDQIPSKIIKDPLDVFLGLITFLVDLSLKSGCLPKIFKEAIILPIHKGDNPRRGREL